MGSQLGQLGDPVRGRWDSKGLAVGAAPTRCEVLSRCVLPRGGSRVMLAYASGQSTHGAAELRVSTVVAFCATWNGGGVVMGYG